MGKAERERRHRANLARIEQVQRVVGKGDRMRVDQVGTLLERARLFAEELQAHKATELGLAAFERLLARAEEQDTPSRHEVLAFLDAITAGRTLPLGSLRGVPAAVGDDMLDVLDAFRHARLTLAVEVRGGADRVGRVLAGRPVASA